MDEITTRLVSMPVSAKGYTLMDHEGDYNVFLNSRHTHEQQMRSFQHELDHIRDGDFYNEGNADTVETHSHKGGLS